MTSLDLWITSDGQLLTRHGTELYRRSHDVRWVTEETAWYHRLTPSEKHEVERWIEANEAVRKVDPHLAVVQIKKRRGDQEGTLTVERNFISILTGQRERGEISRKRVDMEMLAFLQALVDQLQAEGFEGPDAAYSGDAYYRVSVPVLTPDEAADAAEIMLEFSRAHAP